MLAHVQKAPEVDTEPGQVFREIKREGQGLYMICFGDHRIWKYVCLWTLKLLWGFHMGTPVGGYGSLRGLQPLGSPELSPAIPWVHLLGAPSVEGAWEGRGKTRIDGITHRKYGSIWGMQKYEIFWGLAQLILGFYVGY